MQAMTPEAAQAAMQQQAQAAGAYQQVGGPPAAAAPPAGYPGAQAAPNGYPGAPPPAQPAQGQPQYFVPPTPPPFHAPPAAPAKPPAMGLSQALSASDIKKMRKMSWVNFAFTILQLGCSLAVILITANHLEESEWIDTIRGRERLYTCLFSTDNDPTPCRYAYALASISILLGFALSVMQCLTLDCCGMGRAFEMMFDLVATLWWAAGAITLTTFTTQADKAGIPQSAARQGVIAMCWVATATFICLAIVNSILMKKYGKAFKKVKEQAQAAAMANHGDGLMAVHVGAPPPTAYPAGPAAYPTTSPPQGWSPAAPPQGYPAPAVAGAGAGAV